MLYAYSAVKRNDVKPYAMLLFWGSYGSAPYLGKKADGSSCLSSPLQSEEGP